MLDSLLDVQRILTAAGDNKRLALLYPLTGELQDDYLSLVEAALSPTKTKPAPQGATKTQP